MKQAYREILLRVPGRDRPHFSGLLYVVSPRVQEMGVTKADFHCYCGKVNLAKKVGATVHSHADSV